MCPLAAAAHAIGVVLADVVAPGIGCLRSRACCILIFGFREQPIGLAGRFGEPCRVEPGVVPGDEDRRPLAAAKAAITDTLGTIAIGDAGIPLIECHREFGDRKRFADRDGVLWAFRLKAALLARWRSHHERARRDHHHVGTIILVLLLGAHSLKLWFGSGLSACSA